jgi:sulfur-oxidizing protein SoxA
MKGVAARYPAIPPGADSRSISEGRINLCRVENQKAERLAPESRRPAVAYRLCRASVARPADRAARRCPRLASWRAEARRSTRRRQGQLNLSCALCHDDNAGKKLAGIAIPAGPSDRLSDLSARMADLGSLKRRLRNCLVGLRAEPYAWTGRSTLRSNCI